MTTLPVFQRPTTPPPARSWRLTTAARAFALAFAIGQALSTDSLGSAAVLIALGVLAASACALDLHPSPTTARLAPVAEGVLATVLVVGTGAPATPLLVYLAVPPVVAGLRTGWVTVANTSLAMGIVVMGHSVGARALDVSTPNVAASVPWLVLGLGAGLLAARQTRSVRALEESQAPYVEAHRLLTQLHTVAHNLAGSLDTSSVAHDLVDRLHSDTGATRTALLVRADDAPLTPLAATGADRPMGEEGIARRCARSGRAVQAGRLVALPVRVADDVFGAVVLYDAPDRHRHGLSGLQATVDEHSLRLDTAMLFDNVRSLATTDERHRLAREIHDGVGQEVASLGYLVDELTAETDNPATLQAAGELRREVTRVVSELRQSIFDLRQGVDEAGGLSGALAEYVREVCTRSGLRVHLLLDEKGAPLAARTEAELLRIAQEAISNVRKHANAVNLWVTLATEGSRVSLVIEDDGIGSPVARAGHYGLHTMRERAERIDADLTISERPDGGTAVTVQSRVHAPPVPGDHHDHHRAARR